LPLLPYGVLPTFLFGNLALCFDAAQTTSFSYIHAAMLEHKCEALRLPPSMVAYRCLLFKPQIFSDGMKITDFGEPQIVHGRARKEVGFWRRWTLPLALAFEII
jgi:hypothetical protein